MKTRPAHVVVIGGGFCGAFFAAQLAQHATVAVKISVVEPRETLGAGVAYSTPDPAHRLNVPAARMILFPDNPGDFDDWMRRAGELERDPQAGWCDGHIYPRRAAFGRYMAELLAARRAARPDAGIEHVRAVAVSVARAGAGYLVSLEQGGALEADLVVLAASHPPPRAPAGVAALAGDPGLIDNPWRPDVLASVAADARVLIIGCGLTMADVVASLQLRGHTGPITAFSRRGLLPRGHIEKPLAQPFVWFDTHDLTGNVVTLLAQVRELVAGAARDGVPWQAVFDDIRANGQRLWRNFDDVQRRRFLRHLRVFWDAHRYRVAPQVEQVLKRRRQDGSLLVMAASLRRAGRGAEGIDVVLQPRGRPADKAVGLTVDCVVVTTGPDHASVVMRVPVLRSLVAEGLLVGDDLGLGVAVDARGQALNKDGDAVPGLFVVGPLARAQYGELMGMPQVSAQPNDVATYTAGLL